MGADYASGDNSADDQSLNTFNQLFPLAHAYYGFADVLGRQNAIDLKTGVITKPFPRTVIRLDGHTFFRASTQDGLYSVAGGQFRAGDAGASAYIGAEADLTAIYSLDRHTRLQGGLSYFLPGEFLAQSGNSSPLTFAYLEAQYTF